MDDPVTPFSSLLQRMRVEGTVSKAFITEDWLQGRAAFGGLVAALCLEATYRAFDDLPPLRSAQFTFVGPAGSEIRMTPSMLRRGKSVSFAGVDLEGESGLAARAVLSFGAPRPSATVYSGIAAPSVPPPEQCPPFFGKTKPTFARHFEYRHAGGSRPLTGASNPDFLVWIRHKDPGAGARVPALVALADAPPVAALALVEALAPISTMTWMLDILDVSPPHASHWHLVRSKAETVRNGYSGHAVNVWTAAGDPILAGRQNVAVFF
jgi:acyl-CoA thioesterase